MTVSRPAPDRTTASGHPPTGHPPAGHPPPPCPPARLGTEPASWWPICPLEWLRPGRGAAALVGGTQVALFRLDPPLCTAPGLRPGPGDMLHAVGNVDPFTGAAVISRGIVGDRNGTPVVVSPVHKQAFRLADGRCLDDDAVALPVFRVRAHGADLQIGIR